MIVTAPNTYYDIQIKPDYVADTIAEVQANLSPYTGKYIQIIDQNSQIFFVYQNDNTLTLVDAVDSANYITVLPSDNNSLVSIGTFTAYETISGGNAVNLVLDAGITKIRNADASLAIPAHGFVINAVLAGASDIVYSEGLNTAMGGVSFPTTYYLGSAGSLTTIPLDASNSLNTGKIVQKIAESITTSTALFAIEEPVYL